MQNKNEMVKAGRVLSRLVSTYWTRGQVDKATGFGPVDPGFESLRVRHLIFNTSDEFCNVCSPISQVAYMLSNTYRIMWWALITRYICFRIAVANLERLSLFCGFEAVL